MDDELESLLAELARLRVGLTVVDGGLRCEPASSLTPEIRDRIRQQKPALIELLATITVENIGGTVADAWDSAIEPDPCHECGGLERWQTILGNWRCQKCDPPTIATKLRTVVERIRARTK